LEPKMSSCWTSTPHSTCFGTMREHELPLHCIFASTNLMMNSGNADLGGECEVTWVDCHYIMVVNLLSHLPRQPFSISKELHARLRFR
jgi:hypothetical protein